MTMSQDSLRSEQIVTHDAAASLATLLKEARINEEKLIHLQTMEMKLLTADSFYEVCQTLIDDYRRQFNLRAVTLTLLDRGRQLHKYLEETEHEDANCKLSDLDKNVFFVSDYEEIGRLQSLRHAPVLTPLDEPYEKFFGKYVEDVESLALLPLNRKGELIGFLALGSVDPERYTPTMATDFVTRLASIVAVCVQNAVHLEQVKLMGMVDPLTQLSNRRYFFKRLPEELKRAQRNGEKVSCLYIDVDDFKSVNDTYGHSAGDMILMHVARVIDYAMRDSDVVARLGGEEFGVILPTTSEEKAVETAQRLIQAFADMPCEMGRGRELGVTVSVGAACYNTSEEIAEPAVLANKLVDRADRALYKAKGNGKNTCVAYSSL